MLAGVLNAVLDGLNGTSTHITASSILTGDGLVLACVPPGTADDQMGAISACLFSAGGRLAEKVLHNPPEQIILISASGCILMSPVGDEATIAVLMSPGADVGVVAANVGKAAAKIMAELACPIFTPHPPKQQP